MKAFRYKLGHVAGETMTVGELMAELAKFPADMPILYEWEGQHVMAKPDRVATEDDIHWGEKEDACTCLVINADNY